MSALGVTTCCVALSRISQAKQDARSGYASCNSTTHFFLVRSVPVTSVWYGLCWGRVFWVWQMNLPDVIYGLLSSYMLCILFVCKILKLIITILFFVQILAVWTLGRRCDRRSTANILWEASVSPLLRAQWVLECPAWEGICKVSCSAAAKEGSWWFWIKHSIDHFCLL